MANYTLKRIPPDLYKLAEASAQTNFRSLNQEIIYRLQLSYELEEAAASKVHAVWIDEALQSGPAQPAVPQRWKDSLKAGLAKAKARK